MRGNPGRGSGRCAQALSSTMGISQASFFGNLFKRKIEWTHMDARPILGMLARVLDEHGLEAVLIGNAAAALEGAPVTTLDFDFLFRKTPGNIRKLKAIADDDGLQIDFMGRIDGITSPEGLRRRVSKIDFGGHPLWVASLADVIKSKRAAGRPRDLAALETLERALHEKENTQTV
jgi:hypothetical protein